MAFGFTRERGTAAGYVNVDNPAFAPGQRLSRRQYRKYLDALGLRRHAPGVEAIRRTEARLEALRETLEAAHAALDERERELAAREAVLAERELAASRKAVFHRERTAAGLRRYRTLVEMYQDSQRAKGVRMNKREVAADPAFQAIVKTIRDTDKAMSGKARKHDPNASERAMFRRKQAFDQLGGAVKFREDYERRFGHIARQASTTYGARYARARGR